jgi:hypothetical protein
MIMPVLALGLISPASAALTPSQKQQVVAALKPEKGTAPVACKQKDDATLEHLQECRNAIKKHVTAKGPTGQDLDSDIDHELKATVSHFSGVKIPLKTAPVTKLKYTNLDQSITSNNASNVRKEAAEVMGITDASHGNHGSNFNQTQSVREIIKDVFSQVKDPNKRITVAKKVEEAYKFDPR